MDVSQFLLSLLNSLSGLEFVEKVDFTTEVFILKGRACLKAKRYLQVYFNEHTGTTAFALIEKGKRIWGIDFDNMRGWHLHPFGESESHRTIREKDVQDIVKELSEVWEKLP
jgi:hypothetical protein